MQRLKQKFKTKKLKKTKQKAYLRKSINSAIDAEGKLDIAIKSLKKSFPGNAAQDFMVAIVDLIGNDLKNQNKSNIINYMGNKNKDKYYKLLNDIFNPPPMEIDVKLDLLVSGYICKYIENDFIIPHVIIEIIIKFYKIIESFNKNNYTQGLTISDDALIISQNGRSKCRSILGSYIVQKNESFFWSFLVTKWDENCCRFGVMNPSVRANGSLWTKKYAVCMCIHPYCWKSVWRYTGSINSTQNRKPFATGDKCGIKVENKNDQCYVTFYHNDKPIKNAIDVDTPLKRACIFVEICGIATVSMIDSKCL